MWLSLSQCRWLPFRRNSAQINAFVALMFESSGDFERFKLILRDFLISLKEFSAGGDTADLFIDEKEDELERRNKEEREAAIKVPVRAKLDKKGSFKGSTAEIDSFSQGMLKPAQLDEDTELW
jgi:exportin-1